MRISHLAALAALALIGTASSQAPAASAGLGVAHPVACARGYHVDAGGNCQPNVAQVNRYCPRGTVFHPTFDGWTCDPPPREAYFD